MRIPLEGSAVVLGLALVACAQVAAPVPDPKVPVVATPSPTPTPPAPSVAPGTSPTPSAGPGSPAVDAFATVTADRLRVRAAPGIDAPPLLAECLGGAPSCLPLVLGAESNRTVVFVVEGPTVADGFRWYRVAPVRDGSFDDASLGWVADGDEVHTWLEPRPIPCPSAPVTLEAVLRSALPPLSALHCLGDQSVTLRAYHVATPDPHGGDCIAEPAWLVCDFGGHRLLAVDDPALALPHALPVRVHPDAGPMPDVPGWVEVTGQFDHPAAAGCADAGLELRCRTEFVVTLVAPAP